MTPKSFLSIFLTLLTITGGMVFCAGCNKQESVGTMYIYDAESDVYYKRIYDVRDGSYIAREIYRREWEERP